MLRRFDDADSGDVHDCAHPAFLLIGHKGSNRGRWLGGEMAIDVVMVDDTEGSLPLRDGFHNLRTFLVDLRPCVVFQSFKEGLGFGVAIAGPDDRHTGLEIFTAGIRNGQFSLPLGVSEIQQGFELVRLDQRRIVDDDPKSA